MNRNVLLTLLFTGLLGVLSQPALAIPILFHSGIYDHVTDTNVGGVVEGGEAIGYFVYGNVFPADYVVLRIENTAPVKDCCASNMETLLKAHHAHRHT